MYKYLLILITAILLFSCQKSSVTTNSSQQPLSIGGEPVLSDSSLFYVDYIDSVSAVANVGNLQSEGSSPLISRGVVWGTTAIPTTDLQTKTDIGTDQGYFDVKMTNLSSNTTYYVREFATNSKGTTYGAQKIFTTYIQFKDVAIGKVWAGGMVFYFLQPGDPTYDPNVLHGLIVNISHIRDFDSIAWNTNTWNTDVSGTNTGVTFGISSTGNINSEQYGYCAAKLATWGYAGYSDWGLPSKDELNQIYLNVGPGAVAPNTNIGNFMKVTYWTSSQFNIDSAYSQSFVDGTQSPADKYTKYSICQIRAF
jgi:hypothetical protein